MSTRLQAIWQRVNTIKHLDTKIARLNKELKKAKSDRSKLATEAIEFMEKEGTEKIANNKWNVTIKSQDVPTVNNFDNFIKHVVKKKAWELLVQKVNSKAWRDHDQNIPGVGTFTRDTLSITKRR